MVKAEHESSATEPACPDDQLSGQLASLSGPDDELIPAIPASAGALIFDRKGRLLILKPTYKTGWTIPGGVMEADGESPWEACKREVREECGLTVRTGRLACVDFRRPRPGRPGGIRYLFDCGRLDDAALARDRAAARGNLRISGSSSRARRSRCSGARSGAGCVRPAPPGAPSTWRTAARFPRSLLAKSQS